MNRYLLKKYGWQLQFLVLLCCCWGCQKRVEKRNLPTSPIVILYENDVHCALEGYPKLVDLQEKKRTITPYVTTVSCGDFIQGDAIASISKGKNIVDIMNQVGYDVVTLGNHEFDYGVEQMFNLTSNLKATTVSANFRDLRTGNLPFSPYKIINYGKVNIAYIGLTTTTTPNDVILQTFRDSTGKVIYNFSREDFYRNAQHYIDDAREEGADYVIVLSHVGGNHQHEHPSSMQLIAHTSGIDVVLDGHDHQVIADTLIDNVKGEPVLLSSTGTKFEYLGVLTLDVDGVFTTQLLATASESLSVNQEMEKYIQELKDDFIAEGEQVIGYNSVNLFVDDVNGHRMVRKQETNMGNFCSDAFRVVLNTDIALMNGGGIRSSILAGEITYNACYAVLPFNNTACVGSLTGQELLDALEYSVSNLPQENGSFLQVSGMLFKVDTTIPSSVVKDEEDFFSYIRPGNRRVSDLKIWDRTTGGYKAVDLQKRYTVAGIDYQLKNSGSSGILNAVVLEKDNLGQDVEILVKYIQQFLGGKIDKRYATIEGRIQITE